MDDYLRRKREQDKKVGNEYEQKFIKSIGDRFLRQATVEEDRTQHWDVMDKFGNTYDVKGCKKQPLVETRGEDPDMYDENGKPIINVGWLYGKATYIVFWIDELWYYVPRHHLVKWVESLDCIDLPPISKKELYTPYRRIDKKTEIVIHVKKEDLIKLSEKSHE